MITNSVKPINLTNREEEVANLMSKGLTGLEISTLLEISKNTVKKHIRNIISKSGAANQKEAVSIIQTANYVYGVDGLNSDFYLEHRESRIFIHNDKITSILTSRSRQICCKDKVEEKQGDVYCDGEVAYVEVNGERVAPVRIEKGRFFYISKFKPALKKGEIIERVVKAELLGSFKFPADYFFIDQPTPCGVLKIGVDLDVNFSFDTVEFESKIGTRLYEPMEQLRSVQDRKIEWVINAPLIHANFTVRWTLREWLSGR